MAGDDSLVQIDGRASNLWRKTIRRLRRQERWVLAGKIVSSVVGAAMLGVAGFINPPNSGDLPWKWVLGFAGAFLLLVFGGLVALAEHGGVAEIDEARAALDEAKAAVAESEKLQARLDSLIRAAELVDRRRRERLSAIQLMIETVEAAMLRHEDANQTAPRLLRHAIHTIRKAIDYQGGDFFTLSIFRSDGQKMTRIAAEWSDPERAGENGRAWPQGQGYTGVAWARAVGNPGAEVIEPDTTLPHIASEYPVPSRDLGREALYLSVASIPILVGQGNEVWGVVTATFDRKDAFKRGGTWLERQNVDVIRDVARFAGLLAGLDRLPAPTPVDAGGSASTPNFLSRLASFLTR